MIPAAVICAELPSEAHRDSLSDIGIQQEILAEIRKGLSAPIPVCNTEEETKTLYDCMRLRQEILSAREYLKQLELKHLEELNNAQRRHGLNKNTFAL